MADPNNFASLPTKQKISAIAFFIIGAIVIWQVIGLFRGSKTTEVTAAKPSIATVANQTSKSTPSPQKSALSSPMKPAGVTPPTSNMQLATPSAAHSGSPILSKPTVETGALPPASINVQQHQEQVKYVSAINELQMLKIQKEIAETNQAIVAAKLATTEAEKSINQTLTPMIPAGNNNTEVAIQTGVASKSDNYVVYSVSMELEQWHAVIGVKDNDKYKLYNVMVGDVLPSDGSTVSAIDAKGVTLELAGMEHRIPFSLADLTLPSSLSTPENPASGGAPAPALTQPPPPAN